MRREEANSSDTLTDYDAHTDAGQNKLDSPALRQSYSGRGTHRFRLGQIDASNRRQFGKSRNGAASAVWLGVTAPYGVSCWLGEGRVCNGTRRTPTRPKAPPCACVCVSPAAQTSPVSNNEKDRTFGSQRACHAKTFQQLESGETCFILLLENRSWAHGLPFPLEDSDFHTRRAQVQSRAGKHNFPTRCLRWTRELARAKSFLLPTRSISLAVDHRSMDGRDCFPGIVGTCTRVSLQTSVIADLACKVRSSISSCEPAVGQVRFDVAKAAVHACHLPTGAATHTRACNQVAPLLVVQYTAVNT